jgi:hypothetical protein
MSKADNFRQYAGDPEIEWWRKVLLGLATVAIFGLMPAIPAS